MTKAISILFATLIFFQSTNFHFDIVSSVNEIVEHYELHNERYGDNLIVFLSKHYGDLEESHRLLDREEKKENEKKPIHHDISVIVHVDQMIQSFELVFKRKCYSENRNNIFSFQDEFSSSKIHDIFQPPRLV